MKDQEMIECECGEWVPVEEAYSMEDGGWACPDCLKEMMEEQPTTEKEEEK
jgi:hypothetical protein